MKCFACGTEPTGEPWTCECGGTRLPPVRVDSLVRCDGCRWWNAQGLDAGDGWETESGPTPFGECKRFPPTTVNDGEGTEPIARHDYTLADDWCGEFTPNAESEVSE